MRGEADPRPGVAVRPLAGKRVLVTRRAEQAGSLSARLREHGAEVVETPLIQVEPPSDIEAALRSVASFLTYDDVVFTSANAVSAVATLAGRAGVNLGSPGPRIFAVGPVTAAALHQLAVRCDELPERYTADALAELMGAQQLAGRRVLLPRSEAGRPELPVALRRLGAVVDDAAVYQTIPEPKAAAVLVDALTKVDVLTFASGSAVRAFISATPQGWRRPAQLLVAVIGPSTAAVAEAAGLPPDIVAAEATARGLADAVAAYFVRQ